MDPIAHTVEARDGLALNLWERTAADAEEAVLYVHGSITCSRALFDPPVTGDDSHSWLAATADSGRTAFALDVRGYGDSERPPELEEPPGENGPPVRADLAANDIADAYAVVREEYDAVHLVGVSWGTNTCGRFVERDAPDARSLTQVAPVYNVPYDVEEGLAALGVDPDFGAYYYQEYETVKERQGEADELFEAIWRTQVESNQGVDEDRYLAQTGALADYYDCGRGEPPYDAANVEVPTLVIRGSADAISVREDATTLYDELGSPDDEAEYHELAGADHYVMHGHRRRALYDVAGAFQDRVGRI
ncbi:alpha/beta hydrolase [Halomarina halobia]|uniref:Alpha/beta hydrolase n=1 Tax=Halomarina halobia TaxID=3033386 RepID=A0ABD6A9W3_9EURY|nr:alpha/beta fold hydrolase [Halomarina sp. PSR21]